MPFQLPNHLDTDDDLTFTASPTQHDMNVAFIRSTNPPPVWVLPTPSCSQDNPCLRAGHSLASVSNRIYLFGGYCGYMPNSPNSPPGFDVIPNSLRPGIGVHFNSMYEYSVETATWRILHRGYPSHNSLPFILPKPRRLASMVVHGCSLFVYGGFDIDDNVLADFWEFNIQTITWTQVFSSPPSPSPMQFPSGPLDIHPSSIPVARAEHSAVVDGNYMIVFGGYDGKKKLNDTFLFDFARRQWLRPVRTDQNAPSRRCKHSAVVYMHRMYVVGGFQFQDGDNYAMTDMHVLDLDTLTWSDVQTIGSRPEALQGHKAVVCGDSMYFVGGKIKIPLQSTLIPNNLPRFNLPVPQRLILDHVSTLNPEYIGLPHVTATVASNAPQARSDNDMTSSVPAGQPNAASPTNPGVFPPPDMRLSELNSLVFRYSFYSNRWSVVETNGPALIPRQLHAAVSLPSGNGRMSLFVFGGTDRLKQHFFHDFWELRDIWTTDETISQPCNTCISTNVLFNKPLFSDVKFIVDGKPVYAHRCLLYTRSEYFQNMFRSNMREAMESEIVISEVPYEVFLGVIEFLYSGKVEEMDEKLAMELLKAADMYQIEGLQKICVGKVEDAVTVENAAMVCQVAEMHKSLRLKQYCINFISRNFREVIHTESFLRLMGEDAKGLGLDILEAYAEARPYSSRVKRLRQ